MVGGSGFRAQNSDAALGACGAQRFCGRRTRQTAPKQQEIEVFRLSALAFVSIGSRDKRLALFWMQPQRIAIAANRKTGNEPGL